MPSRWAASFAALCSHLVRHLKRMATVCVGADLGLLDIRGHIFKLGSAMEDFGLSDLDFYRLAAALQYFLGHLAVCDDFRHREDYASVLPSADLVLNLFWAVVFHGDLLS